jgi:2-dehydro-3-deoxygluconokinase
MSVSFGGSESNVAIALSRLGVSATWVGRVGADAIGDMICRELTAERVRVVAPRDTTASTSLMIKENVSAVRTRIWYYRSGNAGSRLDVQDLPESEIQSAQVLHVTGITPALSSTAATTIQRAVALAREANVIVSFDVNYRSRLWSRDDAARALLPLVQQSDILFCGAEEASLFVDADSDTRALARALSDLGPREVLVKLGHRGSDSFIDGEFYKQEPVNVTSIDSVGAGDAFAAGYLAARVNGNPPRERLSLAAKLGALACTVMGDWEGLPFAQDLASSGLEDHVER